MNAAELARSAYGRPANGPRTAGIRPPKDIEYDAFVKMTGAMKRATGPAETAAALYENRQLWTVLAGDVADPDNGLPAPLRAQLFYLSEFTNAHTSKVLAGVEDIGVLIDINTSVMRGLRPQGAGR